MPVVTPRPFTSIDTVKAVPPNAVLSGAIGASSNSSSLSPVMATQISPLPCIAMKLMASGVTSSAAMVRSPSFSRSSSSTTTIMRPALSSSRAVSISANGNSSVSTRCPAGRDLVCVPSFPFWLAGKSSECGLGAASQGICATTSIPASTRARHFCGLFESSRTRVMPRSVQDRGR